jgi:hypothetical protein
MSIEYEVRYDDEYSRHAPLDRARRLLVDRHGARTRSATDLVYDQDKCSIEITLIPSDTGDPGGTLIESVGFRVPAGAKGQSVDRAVEIAFALAKELGWRLFDPQSGSYITAADFEPLPPLRESLAQIASSVRAESVASLARRLWRRTRRQSWQSVAWIVLGGWLVARGAGWLFEVRPERETVLTLGIIAAVTLVVVLLDVVTDVVGEVRTAAGKSTGKT